MNSIDDEKWNISRKLVMSKMKLDQKLGKIEDLLSAWSGDVELCDKLKEVKMILVERIKGFDNE